MKPQFRYLVRVGLQNYENRFLVIDSDGFPKLVKSRRLATEFHSMGVAIFVSDCFWVSYWKSDEHWNRGILTVKKRPKKRLRKPMRKSKD